MPVILATQEAEIRRIKDWLKVSLGKQLEASDKPPVQLFMFTHHA
jgi:hypothetical protein